MKKCPNCKTGLLIDDIEIETGICGSCADREYEREQERREFEYYHPHDPDGATSV